MHKKISTYLFSTCLLFFLCLTGQTCAAAETPPIQITQEETALLKEILGNYIKNKDNPAAKEDLDTIKLDPEEYISLPKPLTADQIKEKDIFKRFKLTYTGAFHDLMERILSNIEDLSSLDTTHQSKLQKSASFCNGVLLYGEPGNGKTYFVEELARATQIPVLSCIGSQLHSSYQHLSAVKVENFFKLARSQTEPCIVFIDEVDSIAGKQKTISSHDSTQTLKTFLIQIDELKKNKNVFIVLATNHPYWLEDSVKSRVPFAIEIERPKTWEEYTAFFKANYKKHTLYNPESPENSSDRLAALVWKKAASFLGGDAYSRRDLDTIIPIILDIKKLAYKKNKKYMHPYIRSINIDLDRIYIDAALKEVHLNYQKKLTEHKEKDKNPYEKLSEYGLIGLKFVGSAIAYKYMDMIISNELGCFYQKYTPHFFSRPITTPAQ